jgi:hypothetical protein
MIPSLYYRYYGNSGSYLGEYQAILDRATALGYTHPSTAQKVKGNSLIRDLKEAGIWSLLDVFYVFATDGDSDFATLNWKSPSSFQCTKVNSPTFTTNVGFNGNGTTSYLNTNWIPSTNGVNWTLNSAQVAIHYNSMEVNSGYYDGARTTGSTGQTLWNPANAATSLNYRINAGSAVTSTYTPAVGFYRLGRSNGIEQTYRHNNGLLVTEAINSESVTAQSMYLGAVHDGTSVSSFSVRKMSMAAFGGFATSYDSDFYTAWNTYFTSL